MEEISEIYQTMPWLVPVFAVGVCISARAIDAARQLSDTLDRRGCLHVKMAACVVRTDSKEVRG
jgi:hypothetical protein